MYLNSSGPGYIQGRHKAELLSSHVHTERQTTGRSNRGDFVLFTTQCRRLCATIAFLCNSHVICIFCCVIEELNDHEGGLRPDLSPLRISKASRAAGPPPLPLLLSIPFSEDDADTEGQLR